MTKPFIHLFQRAKFSHLSWIWGLQFCLISFFYCERNFEIYSNFEYFSLFKYFWNNLSFKTLWAWKFFSRPGINRYRRELETCSQAKTLKSERTTTTLFSSLFSDESERRVWLSAKSKILAFTFESFGLCRLK